MNFSKLIVCSVLALAGLAAPAKAEVVAYPGASFAVACANGANYVLESGPVAEPGQIVTARFHFNPHHVAPVRLIPMGNGYRYAGRDFWLDGIKDQALLYLSKYDPIPCQVGRM